ncbi:MAG TPA: ABC transporter ATP-binding protein, partial [Tepidisphaeraceae bacterium]|nr:ABC transporter ATP-binding protein [Tepidisphaeraceae bacterium]
MKYPESSKTRAQSFRKTGAKASADGKSSNGKASLSSPKTKGYIRDYIRWLWPYRWTLAGLLVIAVITAALDMLWPLAIKRVIDLLPRQLPSSDKLRQLNILGAAIVVILVLKQALDSFRSFRTTVLNAKVIFRLRKRLFERLLGLSLGELAEMKAGGITSRLSGDVDSVSGLVQMAIISPGVALIRVMLTCGILLVLSWRLAIAAAFGLPLLALASYGWLRIVRPIYRSMREDRSNIDARVTETFGGIRVVRSFRREPREELGYALGHHTVIRKTIYAEWMELVLATLWGLLIPGISLVIVWYGGLLVMNGRATVGDIFAFQIYAVLLIQPVWQIVSSVSQTQKSLAAMERVFEVLNMTPDKPDAPDAVDAPPAVLDFNFDHVTFEYRAGTPVVRNFNLKVRGGATVALVGPSGAGKTTLTDLVARFYDPTSGTIRLNGIDLRKIRLASYRSMLAVVQQDVFLFDGTVRENIAYGLRGATDEDIDDAARRANAHVFIDALPQGYDTLIGERGFKLSGGQRQRLSIARAILANPQILILDEATSNLDTESEQLIQASLAELFARLAAEGSHDANSAERFGNARV